MIYPDEFDVFHPAISDDSGAIDETPLTYRQVDNMLSGFERINPAGAHLGFHTRDSIPRNDYKPYLIGPSVHFQGIQRLAHSPYLLVSAGHEKRRAAHLFLVKAGSRPHEGPWRSNRIIDNAPPDDDTVVLTLQPNDDHHLSRGLGNSMDQWHAGGISCWGNLAVVPVEDKKTVTGSTILFYDFSEPTAPKLLNVSIARPRMKSGSVAVTKVGNGRYLVGVMHKSETLGRVIDFYLSKSARLLDGFECTVTFPIDTTVAGPGQDCNFADYQNIEFLHDKQGQLYILGMHNNRLLVPNPIYMGHEFLDLFRVDFDCFDPDRFNRPLVTKIANKQLKGDRGEFNLDAGGGAHVTSRGELIVYGCYHFKDEDSGVVNFSEFRGDSMYHSPSSINAIAEGWADLYDDSNFRDRFLSVAVDDAYHIDDFARVWVRDARFNDKTSSIRFQLPPTHSLELFEHANFSGDRIAFPGGGYVTQVANLKDLAFGDVVSSMRITSTN